MIKLIVSYYEQYGLKWPTTIEALMWAQTEMAEAYELLLARDGGWIHNQNYHSEFDSDKYAEELGDVIMMLLVAGIVEGVNPLTALSTKLHRKHSDFDLVPYLKPLQL
jgi:NTP pyrophosphatase (non-canonical NTP hydrolase)